MELCFLRASAVKKKFRNQSDLCRTAAGVCFSDHVEITAISWHTYSDHAETQLPRDAGGLRQWTCLAVGVRGQTRFQLAREQRTRSSAKDTRGLRPLTSAGPHQPGIFVLCSGAERLTADVHLFFSRCNRRFFGLLGRCRLRNLQPFVNMQETGT